MLTHLLIIIKQLDKDDPDNYHVAGVVFSISPLLETTELSERSDALFSNNHYNGEDNVYKF